MLICISQQLVRVGSYLSSRYLPMYIVLRLENKDTAIYTFLSYDSVWCH